MAGGVVAAIVATARQKIVDHFTDAGAIAPDRAIAFAPGAGRIERRLFRRMVDFGALVEAAPGRYYLDEKALVSFRKESLARVLGMVAIAGFAAAGAIAFGG